MRRIRRKRSLQPYALSEALSPIFLVFSLPQFLPLPLVLFPIERICSRALFHSSWKLYVPLVLLLLGCIVFVGHGDFSAWYFVVCLFFLSIYFFYLFLSLLSLPNLSTLRLNTLPACTAGRDRIQGPHAIK